MNQKLLPVLAFFSLAFSFSWVANEFIPPFMLSHIDLKTILTGLGPALSGLVCYRLFNTPNTYQISLSGTKPLISYGLMLLALLLPLLMSPKPNKALLMGAILTQFIYTLGEELGWRHYLLNVTHDFTRWTQSMIIGVVWFVWHYSILPDPTTMLTGQPLPLYLGLPGLLMLLTLFSHLFGGMVIRTQAVLFPTLIHYIGKVGPGSTALLIIGLVVATYVFWQKLSVSDASTS